MICSAWHTRKRDRLLAFRRIRREGVIQCPTSRLAVARVRVRCGLVVGAFAVIFAIRKTPEVRDLTRLGF